MEPLNYFNKELVTWYNSNKRDLPWRNTQDPYKIWISEIILQQTRVVQGLDYYNRFIERFPSVDFLAEAEEQEVLKYWQGLGYYSRARNLHATAQRLKSEFNDAFPEDYKTILSLKGIGEYTAAAIASFAFNQPYPTVDGNVFRVLSRLFTVDTPIDTSKGKKIFTELAFQLIDKNNPGLFNQAMMEFGALQCTPGQPDCTICPLRIHCLAYAGNRVSDLPVKQNQTKAKEVYLYYFHIRYKDCFYLVKRHGKGIWQNLFEFPSVESERALTFDELVKNPDFQSLFPSSPSEVEFKLMIQNRKHVLSHRVLYATFYEVRISEEPESLKKYSPISHEDLIHYPLHRLMELFFEC
jgi:A/G-specific adenine glycosylase